MYSTYFAQIPDIIMSILHIVSLPLHVVRLDYSLRAISVTKNCFNHIIFNTESRLFAVNITVVTLVIHNILQKAYINPSK